MIKDFLKEYSGRIVALGDTFDYMRSNVINESKMDYIKRTEKYFRHISEFIGGNHDAYFLSQHNDVFGFCPLVYKRGPVLAIHGHQFLTGFRTKKEKAYLKYWNVENPVKSKLNDVEVWFYKNFANYFIPTNKKAIDKALSMVIKLDRAGFLDDEVKYIISGHTHLPFRKWIEYKGRRFFVANTGSAIQNNRFNPVYIKEIDRIFVSDLHIGSDKSWLWV